MLLIITIKCSKCLLIFCVVKKVLKWNWKKSSFSLGRIFIFIVSNILVFLCFLFELLNLNFWKERRCFLFLRLWKLADSALFYQALRCVQEQLKVKVCKQTSQLNCLPTTITMKRNCMLLNFSCIQKLKRNNKNLVYGGITEKFVMKHRLAITYKSATLKFTMRKSTIFLSHLQQAATLQNKWYA